MAGISDRWADSLTRMTQDWYQQPRGVPDQLPYPFRAIEGVLAVELKTSITPGGSATGWVLSWDSDLNDFSDPPYDETEDTTITVYDPQNRHRSLGYDNTASGERGAIVYVDSNNAVVAGIQQARMIRCQAKIASGNTLSIVDHVAPMDSGQSPVAEATTELTLSASGWETDNDAWGIATWDEVAAAYRPLDFPCPA